MLPTEASLIAAEIAPRSSVLIADDHALLRTGVANIINQEPDLRVVAEAGNGIEAVAAFDAERLDESVDPKNKKNADGPGAYRALLTGIAQHSADHAGQIVLLRMAQVV